MSEPADLVKAETANSKCVENSGARRVRNCVLRRNSLGIVVLAAVLGSCVISGCITSLPTDNKSVGASEGAVSLGMKYTVGKRYVFQRESIVQIRVSPWSSNTTTVISKQACSVFSSTPGTIKLQIEFLSISASNYPVPPDTNELQYLSAVQRVMETNGAHIWIYLNSDNKVVRIEGVDQMIDRMPKGGFLMESLPDAEIRRQIEPVCLPHKPVQIGNKWRGQQVVGAASNEEAMKISTINVEGQFVGYEQRESRICALLHYRGEGRPIHGTSDYGPVTVKIELISGKALLDPKLGQFVETDFKVKVEATGLVSKESFTVESKSRLLSVEDLAVAATSDRDQ